MDSVSARLEAFGLQPLVGALGAQLTACDVTQLDESGLAALRSALRHFGVLVLRAQSLDAVSLAAFAERLGPLGRYPFVEPLPEHPNVVPIIKEADGRVNFGGAWHSDTAYLPQPPEVTALYAVDVPAAGGDTLFADMRLAHSALSGGMQSLLATLGGVFTAAGVHGADGAYEGVDHPMQRRDDTTLAENEVVHALVREQAETGRAALYCSPTHTVRIDGLRAHESRPLLEWLFAHAASPEFTARVRWAPGTLVLWDNSAVMHYALNDYDGVRRELWRVIIERLH